MLSGISSVLLRTGWSPPFAKRAGTWQVAGRNPVPYAVTRRTCRFCSRVLMIVQVDYAGREAPGWQWQSHLDQQPSWSLSPACGPSSSALRITKHNSAATDKTAVGASICSWQKLRSGEGEWLATRACTVLLEALHGLSTVCVAAPQHCETPQSHSPGQPTTACQRYAAACKDPSNSHSRALAVDLSSASRMQTPAIPPASLTKMELASTLLQTQLGGRMVWGPSILPLPLCAWARH